MRTRLAFILAMSFSFALAEQVDEWIGRTETELLAEKGRPKSSMTMRTQKRYIWSDLEVTVERGVVIEFRVPPPKDKSDALIQGPLPEEEILFTIERAYTFGAGGVAEYRLYRIPATKTVWFSIKSLQKNQQRLPVDTYTLMVMENEVDNLIAALQLAKMYAGTAEAQPQVVGNFSGSMLYFKAPSFLTYLGSSSSKRTLNVIQFLDGKWFEPPFLSTVEMDMMHAILLSWKNGGDYSAITDS